jgi:hypothetical protein
MFCPKLFGPGTPLVRKRAWVCLLLAITFVYNPFLISSITSGSLSLRHPPSYRATVASPELLRFRNPENLETAPILDPAVVEHFNSLKPRLQSFGRAREIDVHFTLPALAQSGNLWSRPPPLA